ncbi:MAG TPA: hypothetical protein ACHBZA_08300 [Arsenophonus apicola]|uniref:hypothetical protein n=1 Tax=Arsenophonus TaxID=637 RepID=UPI0015D853E7|nr:MULTISPECIES: hypothetical protein [Arsenophonus]UBX29187.1 hypothetical protein LDL57_00285 [Arsenophonus apicola]
MDYKIKQPNKFDYYFDTNNSKQEITIAENIKVILYYKNLTLKKQNKIIKELEQTVDNFKILANLENINPSEQPLEIYIFDNKEDYQYYGKEKGLGTEGGMFYKENLNNPPTIYIYQQGNILNLKHEFTHYLTNINIPNAGSLPNVLTEGIADYIEHLSDKKFNSQSNSIDLTEYEIKTKNINQLLELKYSDNFHDNDMVYKAGHAIIMYLNDKNPELLNKILHNENPEQYLKLIKKENNKFKDWLTENNTDNAMQKINALEVTKGKFIASKKEIIDGEIKDVNYYTANIKNLTTKELVGEFATVEYMGFGNYIRCSSAAKNIHIDINLDSDYRHLKLIKKNNNEFKLIFTNKDGTKNFTESSEYQYQRQIVKSKYAKQNSNEPITDEKIDEIIAELIQINANTLTNTDLTNRPLDTIFSVKKLGNGMASALSLYNEEEKVSELLCESGVFKQIEGQENNEMFIFHNGLQRFHVNYDNKAYLAIENEDGQYKAAFIDGRAVNNDPYFDFSHLHKNELLSPNITHINQEKLPVLQLKNTKIYNHKDSTFAQYSAFQKEHGHTIKKGELLDNKGSASTEDDVHKAELHKENKAFYDFKTIGFYINEELRDQNNNLIDGSDLFIHDHGKNIRYQLPKEITYLKLIKKDNAYKLAVCDQEGTEYTDIPDEYRLIDPIFAHQYEKKDHSNKHLNIGLIDFKQYTEGTLFKLKYDPNDYQIPRDKNNEIVRISDNDKYFTKVKIFHNDTEIGMLSNDHHNFQGDIFFSIDYNYSYNDFLASYSPQVDTIEETILFEQGSGDIGDTNRGYTDYKKINFGKNKNLDYESTTEILYNEQPSSYYPSYQLLANNQSNENVSYHRQHSNIGYAGYQDEINECTDNDNGMINSEEIMYI